MIIAIYLMTTSLITLYVKSVKHLDRDIIIMITGPYLGFFCLRGQTAQTITGISRIQSGFLVKHYVRKKNISFPGGGNCPPCPPPPPPRYVRPWIMIIIINLYSQCHFPVVQWRLTKIYERLKLKTILTINR